jgi:hypothetical protein
MRISRPEPGPTIMNLGQRICPVACRSRRNPRRRLSVRSIIREDSGRESQAIRQKPTEIMDNRRSQSIGQTHRNPPRGRGGCDGSGATPQGCRGPWVWGMLPQPRQRFTSCLGSLVWVAVVEAKQHHSETATRPRPASLGQVAPHPMCGATLRTVRHRGLDAPYPTRPGKAGADASPP